MIFNDLNPKDNVDRKCTIQKTGKLGFSSGAADKLELESGKFFRISVDGENPDNENLYLREADQSDDLAFKVQKAGDYFYINLRYILDQMGVNYKQGGISFTMRERQHPEFTYYELMKEQKGQEPEEQETEE